MTKPSQASPSNHASIWSAMSVAGADEARALQQRGAVAGEVGQRDVSPPMCWRRFCTRPRMPETDSMSSSVIGASSASPEKS